MNEHTKLFWAEPEPTFNPEPTQLDRIEAKLDKLLERKKPKQSLLTEWIVPDYIDQDIWNQYLKMRKEKGNSMIESVYISQLKKFELWHKNKVDSNEVLRRSIENGWVGLFPERNGYLKNGQPEIYSQSHKPADFSRDIENSLDATDPYASLK